MAAAAGCGMFVSTVRQREAGRSVFAFLLDSDNFNDWGKVSRIVFFISMLAAVSVFTMHMIAFVFGGPIVDLDNL